MELEHCHYFLILKKLALLTVLVTVQCNTPQNQESVVNLFKNLNPDPQVIYYKNTNPVNNKGGHIQGIQLFSRETKNYVFLTGSSGTYSYYGVAKLGAKARIISINKILETPFKHAGGFQIYKNFMAIGIEDNEARDRSKIYLYKIRDAQNPPTEPVSIINRSGNYERATAGAVGLTQIDNHFLIVVGDWDSNDLDFYVSTTYDKKNIPVAFKKVYSINTAQANKENWINPQWHSYQNINIIRGRDDKLYLVGLGLNDTQKNVADLYKLDTKNLHSFSIQKIASKRFEARKGASFRAGAGIYYDNNQLKIVSSTDHIQSQSALNIYTIKKGLLNE